MSQLPSEEGISAVLIFSKLKSEEPEIKGKNENESAPESEKPKDDKTQILSTEEKEIYEQIKEFRENPKKFIEKKELVKKKKQKEKEKERINLNPIKIVSTLSNLTQCESLTYEIKEQKALINQSKSINDLIMLLEKNKTHLKYLEINIYNDKGKINKNKGIKR